MTDVQERLSNLEARFGNTAKIGHTGAQTNREGPKKRLLWVDDFPSNNAFIVEHLQEKGIEVEISLSTDDAINKLKYNMFPAIVTDLGRIEGGVDNPFAGLDLIKRVREKGNNVPILVFAGQRGFQNEEQLVSAGAESVTSSGVDVMAFIEKYVS
ncbi:DNA-binding transcriptional response regulator [Mesorhizobium huakuii]|uniref:response regulator n=1 Tax=Mesorhizobium huakuii TaxID=28104 RepID=UPI0024E13B98|nr:response regulator [Mesorhizobium huakuii]